MRCFALVTTLAFFLGAQPTSAQAAPLVVADDPSALLGLGVEGLWRSFGPPAELLPVRGPEPWQDDVAFKYPGGVTFFVWRDRVWQLRLSAGYAGSVFGVFIGDSVEKAYSLLGKPVFVLETSLVFQLPSLGYPVRLRISAAEGKIADICVFRADF